MMSKTSEAAKFNPPGISLKGKFIGIENIDNNCSIDKYDLICQVRDTFT